MLKKFKKNLAKNPLMVNTYRGIKNTAIIPLKFTSYNIFSLEKFPLKDLLNPKKTSLFKTVWPYTKNGYSRLENVYDLAHEIENKNIKGAFIECGTYKGGCCAVMGAVANFYGCSGRKTWYLDSFEGMPDPSEFDGEDTDEIAGDVLKASVKDVEELIFEKLNLPRDKNIIIRGWFEETLPKFKYQIGDIALLRLDADWYEPTRLILEELYNQVVPGGYLIFDDYGRWQGCRKAVDDFIQKNNIQADMEFLGSAIKGKDGTRTPMYFRKK